MYNGTFIKQFIILGVLHTMFGYIPQHSLMQIGQYNFQIANCIQNDIILNKLEILDHTNYYVPNTFQNFH